MENRICPNCKERGITVSSLALKAVFFKRLSRTHCGDRIKSKPKLLSVFLVDFMSQFFLIAGIIGAIALKSWIIFLVGLFVPVVVGVLCLMFGRLEATSRGIL